MLRSLVFRDADLLERRGLRRLPVAQTASRLNQPVPDYQAITPITLPPTATGARSLGKRVCSPMCEYLFTCSLAGSYSASLVSIHACYSHNCCVFLQQSAATFQTHPNTAALTGANTTQIFKASKSQQPHTPHIPEYMRFYQHRADKKHILSQTKVHVLFSRSRL